MTEHTRLGVEPEAKWTWWAVLCAALVGMVIYASTLRGGLIYDDVAVIELDGRVDSVKHWGLFWTKDYYYDMKAGEGSIDNLYRPLVSMTYAVQVWMHGKGGVFWFHLFNVLMYGACCAVVSMLGGVLGSAWRGAELGRRVAWIAGVLFAAHPVHAEVVCAIVGRAEMMAMLGVVGAVVLFWGGRWGRELSYPRAWGVVGLMVMALLSKEQGMLMPGVLLLAEGVRRGMTNRGMEPTRLTEGEETERTVPNPERLQYAGKGMKRSSGGMTPGVVVLLGVCFLCGGYIVLREQVLGLKFWWDRNFLDPAVQPMLLARGWDRTLIPVMLLGRYVMHLIFPAQLSFDWSGRAIGWEVRMNDPYLWVGAMSGVVGVGVALVLGLGMLWAWRRGHWGSPVWVWGLVVGCFGLTYGVIGNIASMIGTIYGERLIFLPSVFFVVAVAMGLGCLPVRVWAGVVAVLGLAGGLHAGIYAARWDDKLEFYRWSERNQPRSIRMHQLLADELTSRGQLQEAEQVAARGRETMPEYWDIWIQSSTIAERMGKWEEAEQFIIRAAKINPRVGPLAGKLRERRAEAEARAGATTRATTVPATLPTGR